MYLKGKNEQTLKGYKKMLKYVFV